MACQEDAARRSLRIVLTDEQRVSVKHHLGYPNANAYETFVLGVPASLESLFMIEGAMNSIAPQAEPRLQKRLRQNQKSRLPDFLFFIFSFSSPA